MKFPQFGADADGPGEGPLIVLLQPDHLVRQQVCIFFLSAEVGGLSNPRLPTDLCNWRAFLALLDHERLLRVRKLLCLHVIPLPSQQGNRSGKLHVKRSGCGSQIKTFPQAESFKVGP